MKTTSIHKTSLKTAAANSRGFTRADLCATLVTISLLLLLMVAGISASQTTSQSASCLDNLRKLTRAWQQFAIDKQYFAPNPDDGSVIPGVNWVPGFVNPGSSEEFNPDALKDPARSLLFPYLSEQDTAVFRCPGDLREGRYTGKDPQKIGTRVYAARSYSMNAAVGTDPYVNPPGTRTSGPWLDNAHSHTRNGAWRTYGKFDDIVDPSPANLAVLLDEDQYSINDGCYALGMQKEAWIDWPGARHDKSGAVAFADGRAELHPWVDSGTFITNGVFPRGGVIGGADYQWLRSHISASKTFDHTLIIPRPAVFGSPAVKLVWPIQTGTNYFVEFSENLANWQPLKADIVVSKTEVSAVDASTNFTARRFYRFVSKTP